MFGFHVEKRKTLESTMQNRCMNADHELSKSRIRTGENIYQVEYVECLVLPASDTKSEEVSAIEYDKGRVGLNCSCPSLASGVR